MPVALTASFLTAVILHLIPGLSRDSSNFLLAALRIIITAACISFVKSCFKDVDITGLDPLEGHPWFADIRTATREFHLEPDIILYAYCKSCSSCYEKVNGQYPDTCTFKETTKSDPCGAPLTMEVSGSSEPVPIRAFPYQPISSFIARLLSRPEIIEQMNTTTSTWKSVSKYCTDFFGASAVRNLLGPDRKPFLEAPNGEMRLVFSLFVDWFNPYGNKAAGKSSSIGGIYLVCLNLPVHLRYKVENVYIAGLIPGEPRKHHINHVLRPLITDLLALYERGTWFSRTSIHEFGCLVRVALLLLIADAPAARKVAGFAGVTSNHFCHFCTQTLLEIRNFAIDSWVPISRSSHLGAAERWRDAETVAKRKELWNEEHTRWSELLRLPYWDPTKFVVIDPMHNLFLNVVPHHVRDFWGINEAEIHGRKGVPSHTPLEQEKQIQACKSAILSQNLSVLKKLRRTYLEIFVKENCVELTAKESKSVSALATSLSNWVRPEYLRRMPSPLTFRQYQWQSQPEGTILKIPKPHSEPAVDLIKAANPLHIIDQAILHEIRQDMEKIVLPGWVNRAPRRFGSASHGKVSADHWRTLATINLVITLTRLWSGPLVNSRKRDLLHNFMSLVVVLRFSTARYTSDKQITIIQDQLQAYYASLIKLSDKLYPCHHMSLHIPECLRLFGPVHGWWSFPFERYNGLIQRFNHNGKFGM